MTVLNTPLPVTGNTTVNGSVSATESGSWTVNAAQSGPWTVNVPGIDSPGRAPYAAQLDVINGSASCVAEGGGFQGCDFSGFPAVPAGKRLVMTDFSGQARAPTGCKIFGIHLRGSNFVHTTAVPHQNLALQEVADFHETTLNFVDAGQAPIVSMDASCTGLKITDQLATVTGYLVTLP